MHNSNKKHTTTPTPQAYFKRLRYGLFLTFCLVVGFSFAQNNSTITGTFKGNSTYAQVILKQFNVGSSPIARAEIIGETFTLTLPENITPGVYRLQYAFAQNEQYLDIIINGKDQNIVFTLPADEPYAFPTFANSKENQLWYNYIATNTQQLERISLLNQFINAYPNPNASVIKVAQQEWENEKALYWKSFGLFKLNAVGTWAYEMVANRPYYFTNPKDHPRTQDYYKRIHFWDGFNASNPALINTPLYTEHILNYLRYWMNPNMNFSPDEQIKGFKNAVDTILHKFSGTNETKEFAYKYLTLGFKEIGQEEVLQYLDEQYQALAEQCLNETEKSAFEKRMQGYKALKVGNEAPDFVLKMDNFNNEAQNLYQLKSEKTIIVFWSSTCPHCLEEIPKLNEWAATQKNLKVIAVSLDTDKTVYEETIKKFPSLIHTCDYKGWNTEAATKYYIAATPTFIVLDKSKKIIGKFSSWQQVVK
jgi:thiol-disulfide isomerase/thioredoxin